MQAAAELKSAALAEVPADLDTALARADWRSTVAWPVSQREANAIAVEQVRAALAWVDALDDKLARDAALLALPNILAYGRAIVIAALAVGRLNRAGQHFATAVPEIAFLQTGEGAPSGRSDPVLPAAPIRLEFARRAARCYSWTGAARLLPAVLAPSAVALSHNSLLRGEAAACGRPIGFRHAESYLEAARRRFDGAGARDMAERGRDLARSILAAAPGGGECAKRAGQLLEAMVRPHLEKAARDMAALRAVPLPGEIWSGSGGLYAPRAVGLEVMRRGGRAVRYDHGTPRGFVETAEVNAMLEFAVSTDFVLATEGAAAICRERSDERLSLGDRNVAIRGGSGDPAFARLPARRANRSGGRRVRVVYAPTQLLGFRQIMPTQPPDTVYLDWQMRVAEALREMPVDLLCQPHPEGLLRNRPHPLETVATTVRGNFEKQLAEADVFVFDFPTTTALWQAACTDARIVFLDIGAGTMTPEVARLFGERAGVLAVGCDDRNRPILDAEALREAVLSEGAAVDPAPFRRLLAGEA